MAKPLSYEYMKTQGYIPVGEAAELACVHPSTIRRLIDSGILTEERIGKLRFVHRERLAEHYEQTSSLIAARIRAS